MSTFTMTLDEAMELSCDIGLNDYPIFDEGYRPILNKKIIDEFLNQEIGQETVSMFRHAMKREMNKIMPKYNKLYVADMLKFDPLTTIKLSSITNTTGESEAVSTEDSKGSSNAGTDSTSSGESMATSYAYPQQQMNAARNQYASSAQKNENQNTTLTKVDESNERESTDTSKAKQNGVTDYTMEGYQGSPTQLLMQLRESFINIDEMILERIEEDQLFMLVYANGESFTERNRRHGYFTSTI